MARLRALLQRSRPSFAALKGALRGRAILIQCVAIVPTIDPSVAVITTVRIRARSDRLFPNHVRSCLSQKPEWGAWCFLTWESLMR